MVAENKERASSAKMRLESVRIVMVNTTHPGNIGAAARAMKTMGLTALYLVNPQDYPSAEATARASGAQDVLANAVVTAHLDEALEGAGCVIGASARQRNLSWPLMDARRAALHAVQESQTHSVAILFGQERSGLTNEELQKCHYHMMIPTNPDYGSLNVASAIQLMSYELRMAFLQANELPILAVDNAEQEKKDAIVAAEGLENFYRHLEQTLLDIEFLDPAQPGRIMPRLRRLFNRARLESQEVNILRGMFSAAQKKSGVNSR